MKTQERGAALIAALALATMVLPAVGHVLLEVRLESLLRANLIAQTQAYYAAEAGLALGLAELAQRATLDALEHGPDRIAGTADDGRLAAVPDAISLPRHDYLVELTVGRVDADWLELTARADGPRQTRREVRARVRLQDGRLQVAGWRPIR